MEGEAPKHTSLKERAIEELKVFWLITLYLAVFLGAFTVYRRLILKEFGVAYLHYGFALIEALIIAKVILVGQALGLGRRFEGKPLIVSVIYKSVLFGLFVALFGVEGPIILWFVALTVLDTNMAAFSVRVERASLRLLLLAPLNRIYFTVLLDVSKLFSLYDELRRQRMRWS